MENEFLKEYDLFQDLVRLNHPDYFHLTFDTPETTQHFISVSPSYRPRRGKNSVAFYLKNLEQTGDKSVFLLLKWLISTHKIIRGVSQPELLEEIHLALSRMKKPLTPTPIEKYVHAELMRPYTQYLRKLCLLNSRLAAQPTQGKENCASPNQLWYVQYNLLTFTAQELARPCRELHGFFAFAYPLLSTLAGLLNQDSTSLYSTLRKGMLCQGVAEVRQEELEALGAQLASFQSSQRALDFEQEPSMSVRVQNFFSSNERQGRTSLQDLLLN